jgi:hypothetical protein
MSLRDRRRLPGAASAARLAILLLGPTLALFPTPARADQATAHPDAPDASAGSEGARSGMRVRLGAAAIATFGAASYGSAGAAQTAATLNASSPAGVVSGGGFACALAECSRPPTGRESPFQSW